MIKQQNQQQTNSLQKKAEEALSASFAMPIIRTMADDLLEASKGVTVPVVEESAIKIVKKATTTDGVAEKTVQIPKPPLAQPRVPAVNVVTSKPQPASNIILQPETNRAKEGVAWKSVLVGMVAAVVFCLVLWVGWQFLPKKHATIADQIPAETLAFVSIKRGNGGAENAVLPRIKTAFGLADDALGDSWNDLVYGILPGSSPSEPVGYLMTDDTKALKIGDAGEFGFKELENGKNVLTEKKFGGRLDGLSGQALGETSEYRSLLNQLPASSEYLFVKQGEAGSYFKVFSFLPLNMNYSTLISLSPSSQGGKFLVAEGSDSKNTKFVKNQTDWESALKAIPATVLALGGQADLAVDADQWRQNQANNPQMQDFLNALSNNENDLRALKENLSDSYVTGTLQNDSINSDGIAVIRIKDGLVEQVKLQMRNLEKALQMLGPLLGGTAYPDATFADGSYADVAIRYVNFGDSQHSFDYAITDSLLLVATSKNAMQELIDAHKGNAPGFAPLFATQGTGQVGWRYMRFDEKVLDQLPVAWQTFLSGFISVYLEPIKKGVVTGNIAY